MKKILSVLFLLTVSLALAFQGCSDTQKETPEPEPGPGEDTTVVVPPVQKLLDTITMFENDGSAPAIHIISPTAIRSYGIRGHIYNEEGLLTNFNSLFMNHQGALRYIDTVAVEWKDKSLVMKYVQAGRRPGDDGLGASVATYTLNDKKMLEKVVVTTASGKEMEYKAEYTDREFKLIDVKAGKTLYSGTIEAGGTYGDWTTVTAANREGVTIKVGYSEVKNQSGMDLFFMNYCLVVDMPKYILWAHMAGLLPASTRRFNKITAEYEGKSVLLDNLKEECVSSETEIDLDYEGSVSQEAKDAINKGVWGWASMKATYKIKVFERQPK